MRIKSKCSCPFIFLNLREYALDFLFQTFHLPPYLLILILSNIIGDLLDPDLRHDHVPEMVHYLLSPLHTLFCSACNLLGSQEKHQLVVPWECEGRESQQSRFTQNDLGVT